MFLAKADNGYVFAQFFLFTENRLLISTISRSRRPPDDSETVIPIRRHRAASGYGYGHTFTFTKSFAHSSSHKQ